MNDHRAAGQELQSQVMAAARKGQQQAQQTVRQLTSAVQQLRPQLAKLPKPTMSVSGQGQIMQRAPELASKLHARLPVQLQSRVPTPDQLKSSAQQFADQARSVQRSVVTQVRSAASPLAQQAASRLSQLASPADEATTGNGQHATTTKVSHVTVTKSAKAGDKAADKGKDGATGAAKTSKPASSTSSNKTSAASKASPASKTGRTGTGSSSTKPRAGK